jgi:aldehyde dehydrogenase (NAD+)
MDVTGVLNSLNMALPTGDVATRSPIDGSVTGHVAYDTPDTLREKVTAAAAAFQEWREVPAPKRGELVRIFGGVLRDHKEPLAQLVTIESGKIIEEGRGEVQEMIDVCDFAVGLSRQLYGLTIQSERPQHTMQENWLPLGPIGVISAFNFPVAVWAWNAALALVCGDPVVWKPSEKTPLTALACEALFRQAVLRYGGAPEGLTCVALGDRAIGEALVDDVRLPLISATGSVPMGRAVGPRVAKRFGRALLELGGNNAIVVTPSADLEVALPSILFGSVGTTGQRCTSTRRVIVHESMHDKVFSMLAKATQGLTKRIGDPREDRTLIGPLIDRAAFENMQAAITAVRKDAIEVTGGERVMEAKFPDAYYVTPAMVKLPEQTESVHTETFAPLTYIIPYGDIKHAMTVHNAVPQGLSSAIMTTDVREAEYFKQHSDCGIANVNIGTSGAEIGGAFGGEKETGGGRESGSDAWKTYMRRQTSTTYYGTDKPALAQGVKFEI